MKLTPKNSENSKRMRWGTPNTAGVSIPHELAFNEIGHQMADTDVLTDVSLTAKTGTVTCLLGPSGSGKTTLLRIAAGMERQTTGSVLIDGKEVGGDDVFLAPEKRGIGLVFQDYALFPHLNVIDNVMFGLKGMPRDTRRPQAMKMLSRVGLDDRAGEYPTNLSGGEQQRVALARAMAPRPGILLMDEPFSGLDARLRDTMREETLGILRETRATSIIVTHDPEEALRMGDQIALLHRGQLEQSGSGRELYFEPKSLFVAGFFSELNVFRSKSDGKSAQTPIGAVATSLQAGSPTDVAIRINAIEVKTKATESSIEGRVLSSHFTGDHDHLRIGISGTDQAVGARVRAGSLPRNVLEGKADVFVRARNEGSFVFATT